MKSQGKTIFLEQEKVSEIGFMSGKCEVLTKSRGNVRFFKIKFNIQRFFFFVHLLLIFSKEDLKEDLLPFLNLHGRCCRSYPTRCWRAAHCSIQWFGNLVWLSRNTWPTVHNWQSLNAPGVGGGGGGVLGSSFAGYVPLASENPYPIIVYSVANYRPYLSHFGQMSL